MHVGVVEHGVASTVDGAIGRGLALEEDVDQPAVDVAGVGPLGQLEPGVLDRRPDAIGVEGVAHHRVPNPVAPTDALGIADHDDLRLVELDARGAGGHRRVLVAVVHDVGVDDVRRLTQSLGDAESGAPIGEVHRLVGVLSPDAVAARLRVADGVDGQ